jgi:hypothetical protein
MVRGIISPYPGPSPYPLSPIPFPLPLSPFPFPLLDSQG